VEAPVKQVALIGVGGLFLDIYEELESQGFEIIGYIDKERNLNIDLPYLGDDDCDLETSVKKVITVGGIGKQISLRTRLFNVHKGNIINLFFNKAHISRYCKYGNDSGVLVFHCSIVRSRVVLGENIFLNAFCNIGHDTEIGDNAVMSNGVLIGGNVKIGRDCFIGQRANIFQGVTIGNDCLIGANALVTKNVPDNSFVINRDERILKKTDNELV